jgi:hypothetical protein
VAVAGQIAGASRSRDEVVAAQDLSAEAGRRRDARVDDRDGDEASAALGRARRRACRERPYRAEQRQRGGAAPGEWAEG